MNYEKILRRSWEIAKTYKVLWVFGMALAALSGSSNFNSNFNLSSDFFKKGGEGGGFEFPTTPSVEEIPQQTSQVLGATTEQLSKYFFNIPVSIWIILGISILLGILAAMIVSIFIREWTRGALISSIHDIEDQKPTNLRSGSLRGLSTVKRFILLHIVPGFIFFLAITSLTVIFIAIFILIESNPARVILALVGGLTFLALVIGGGIVLTLTIILAEQLIVRKNLSMKESVIIGFRLAKRHFFQMLGMGAIHVGLGCAVGCATVLIILVIFAAIIFFAIAIGKQAGIIAAVILSIPILLLLIFSILIRGIFLVFKTSNWTLLVREFENLESSDEKNKVNIKEVA